MIKISENKRFYRGAGILSEKLANYLEKSYRDKDYKTQTIPTSDHEFVVQISKGGARNVVGMAECLSVIIQQRADGVSVSVGKGKWLDKAVVIGVSMVVLWPLLITAGIGIYKQKHLVNDIWESIETFIMSNLSINRCTNCGCEINAEVKFCPNCGHTVSP